MKEFFTAQSEISVEYVQVSEFASYLTLNSEN